MIVVPVGLVAFWGSWLLFTLVYSRSFPPMHIAVCQCLFSFVFVHGLPFPSLSFSLSPSLSPSLTLSLSLCLVDSPHLSTYAPAAAQQKRDEARWDIEPLESIRRGCKEMQARLTLLENSHEQVLVKYNVEHEQVLTNNKSKSTLIFLEDETNLP